MRLAIPPRYDGRPLPLRRIETRATRTGLVADLAAHLDPRTLAFADRTDDPAPLRQAVGRLFQHFTDDSLEDRFLLEIMPPGVAAGEPAERGFNLGPLCAAPDGPPANLLRTWLHELGHAMYPSEDPHDAETAALLVEIVLWTKLETELPYLVFFGTNLTFLEGDPRYGPALRAALDLIARGFGPDATRYGLDDEARARFAPGNELIWSE